MINKNIHNLSRAVIIDQEHMLLCKTTDLASNFYFLPGGHIEYMESAEHAVLRELLEETNHECSIKRFMGCFEHIFMPGSLSICHNHEYNFIFEVTSDTLKLKAEIPKMETHIDLEWVPIAKLKQIDFKPKPLLPLIFAWLKSDPAKLQSVMI